MFKKIVGLGFSTQGKNAKNVKKYIQDLVESGANEFFTGYNPAYWSDLFGFEVSPNGRFSEHEQITDFYTLKSIVDEVHKHKLEVFINLNARYYTDETWPLILRMLKEFEQIGVDGIICGNISILEHLSQIDYKGKINISTILALYNSESIKFYLENYKINKIILSREVTLREIEALVTQFPDTQFEVFGEGDFCRYNNGLCFAEHKYGAKDICTVVLNDLIIKKSIKNNFKEIILDTKLSQGEKIGLFNDEYVDIFEELSAILTKMEIFLGDEDEQELLQILDGMVKKASTRVDLYFDSGQQIYSKHNQNIITYFKALKRLNKQEYSILQQEIEKSIQTGMKSLSESIKTIGTPKLKAEELMNLYSKGDILNLYSYVFFSQFNNIETVKFPTRGRNYNEKLQLIESVVREKAVSPELLRRNMSIERTHYDLTYIFGEKLWFRELLKKIS